jgi:hypothetical protein
VEPTAVRSARAAILGLAELLEGPTHVSPRGVVLAQEHLTDRLNSPLFDRYCERSVAQAVLDVVGALGVESASPALR